MDAFDSVTVSCPFGTTEADDTFTLTSMEGEFVINVAQIPNIPAEAASVAWDIQNNILLPTYAAGSITSLGTLKYSHTAAATVP